MSTSLARIQDDQAKSFQELNPESTFKYIPFDVLKLIFSWLTEKEAFIITQVCREWKKKIKEIPSFKRAFADRTEEIKDYYRLENALGSIVKFHLNLVYTEKDWRKERFDVKSFGSVSDSGFITVPCEDREGEFTLFSNRCHFLLDSVCIGSVKTTGIFLEPNQPYSIVGHGMDGEYGQFRLFHIDVRDVDQKTKDRIGFEILNCFILHSEDIVVVTTGGIIEIWSIANNEPKLIYCDFPFEDSSEVVVHDASLLGSHLILMCSGSKNLFYSMDTETQTLSPIVLQRPISFHINDQMFLDTIDKRCIAKIDSELICFKEEQGRIKVQWHKSDFAFTFVRTKGPKNGAFFSRRNLDATQLEDSRPFNLKTGEFSSAWGATPASRFGYKNYSMIFEDEKISFFSLANKPIGKSDGYSLVFPHNLDQMPYTVLDVAASQNRIFVLAEIQRQRYLFELTSEDMDAPLDEEYVFSEEFLPEEERSREISEPEIEVPKNKVRELTIFPIAPIQERREAKIEFEIPRENSAEREVSNVNEAENTFYSTSMKVSAIVSFTLALMLTAGMFTALGLGMTNLTLGLAVAALIPATSTIGFLYYV